MLEMESNEIPVLTQAGLIVFYQMVEEYYKCIIQYLPDLLSDFC